MEPKVGVVVLSFNSEKNIRDCLISLDKLTYPNYRVIVVDNASADKTVAIVQSEFPEVKLIRNKKNLGFAGGNNIGIRHALEEENCEYVLLLNDDTVVAENLLEELLIPFEDSPDIGIVGPIIMYQDSPEEIWFAGGSFNEIFCYTRHPLMGKRLKEVRVFSGEVDFISGCCLLAKREVFEKVEPLPGKFFLYFEDSFWCHRVKRAGFNSFLVAKPLVWHKTFREVTPLKAYYFARNPLLFIKDDTRGFLKFSNVLGQIFIRLPFYFFLMVRWGEWRSISAYLRGLVAGLGYLWPGLVRLPQ